MDRLSQYRSIVQQVLNDYYQLYSQSDNLGYEAMLLCDRDRDQYLLMRLGWEAG
jgi:XisI protein